ncbi:unnamed protein product, partial [Ixodes pacificus]
MSRLAIFATLLLLHGVPGLPADDLEPLLGNFKRDQIVPDLIPKVPAEGVKVHYTSSNAVVKMGNLITKEDAAQAPTIEFKERRNNLYTIMMLNPDAPSYINPKYRWWVHWLIVNAEGPDTGRVDPDNVIQSYKGPDPAEGSDAHRYLFLIFCQGKRRINATAVKQWVPQRPSFDLAKFRRRANLYLPFAGNYF